MSVSDPLPSVPLRVLVVDDLIDAADSLRLLLELWGHEVRVEYDGRRALETARDYRPHVVLLDVQMPGMHGGEVARALKSDSEIGRSWVIATTANERGDPRLLGFRQFFDDHLVKPYNLEHLERLLASCAAQAAD